MSTLSERCGSYAAARNLAWTSLKEAGALSAYGALVAFLVRRKNVSTNTAAFGSEWQKKSRRPGSGGSGFLYWRTASSPQRCHDLVT
jgi:hypothetical protein